MGGGGALAPCKEFPMIIVDMSLTKIKVNRVALFVHIGKNLILYLLVDMHLGGIVWGVGKIGFSYLWSST